MTDQCQRASHYPSGQKSADPKHCKSAWAHVCCVFLTTYWYVRVKKTVNWDLLYIVCVFSRRTRFRGSEPVYFNFCIRLFARYGVPRLYQPQWKNLRGIFISSNFEQGIIGLQPPRASIKIAPLKRARRALSKCVNCVGVSFGIGGDMTLFGCRVFSTPPLFPLKGLS